MDMEILKEILKRRKLKAAEKYQGGDYSEDEALKEKKEVIIGEAENKGLSKDGDSLSTDELAPSKEEMGEKTEIKQDKKFDFKPFGKDVVEEDSEMESEDEAPKGLTGKILSKIKKRRG